MADKTKTTNGKNNEPAAAASDQTHSQVRLDDTNATTSYANFCRVSGTLEELVLDFALNSHPGGAMPEVLKLDQRVIMNFYTAKRLLSVLHMAVQRHEATFGPIETDVRKRVSPAATRQA